MSDNKELSWLLVLMKINNLNRSVKETDWNRYDLEAVYDLKDKTIEKILTEKPQELEVSLYYIPYIKYGNASKDRAGALMRQDFSAHPFEYYLQQIPPSPSDYEITDKATIEVVIKCMGQIFSFHQPYKWIQDKGFAIGDIPKKAWINARDFNHENLVREQAAIEKILGEL